MQLLSIAKLFPIALLVLNTSVSFASSQEDQEDGSSAHETEISLVRASSNAESGVTDIRLLLDSQNQIIKLRTQYNQDQPINVSLEQLAQGYVVMEQSGYHVVTLKAEHLSPTEGGQIDLIYLYNAVFRSYKTFPMDLVRAGTNWSLRKLPSEGGTPFNQIFLKKNTFLGRMVGIAEVIPSQNYGTFQ